MSKTHCVAPGQVWTVRLYSWSSQKEEVQIVEVNDGWARYERLGSAVADVRFGRIQVDYLLDNPAWKLGRVLVEKQEHNFRSF
jgi:hypothetical protein